AANASKWDFVDYAGELKSHPVLILTADDGLTEDNVRLAAALKNSGAADVTEQHMATDHSYSDRRIALEAVVVRWLERHQATVARRCRLTASSFAKAITARRRPRTAWPRR